ncbi:hypothetical protein BDF14DRAFT_1754650 [Spinellus fusiger]|nr:hypothetical protein BDF14DRAFT_1754650 [Spinellus fusiger]
MSWKGFQKVVSRLPHQILSKKSEVTKDPEFEELEKRFLESIKVIERLGKDAQQFRDSVAALVMHQNAMASFVAIIYDSNIGREVAEGTIQKRFQQTSGLATQATHDAEAAMAYCRDEVLPELDTVDRDVVRPALELLEIYKKIQKTIIKRQHKLIDYDRFRLSLTKLKVKETRTFSEEKEVFKLEAKLETATEDYNYLNNMLKQELPLLFYHKSQFILPVFNNFYNMQTKIYGIIYARCYELVNANSQHLVTHAMPLLEGFEWRRTQRDVRHEMETMDILKSGGKVWLAASGGSNSSKLTLQERAALREKEKGNEASLAAGYSYPSPPPAYGAPGMNTERTSFQAPKTSLLSSHTPAASPLPGGSSVLAPQSQGSFVLALYDYQAQAEGDLTFRKDDKIELIERTADTNDWWTGRLRGVTGVFPGNYVKTL